MAGTLFVVATPIGNLEDISARALRVLREVALVAAEDTRHTGHLLQRFGLATRTTSFHEHSEKGKAADLVERLKAGESIALVSDAGTPTVSDPGVHLIRLAHEAGIRVEPVPGPSAVTAALSASGFPGEGFVFLGFPPTKGADRRAWFDRFESASSIVPVAVFYEAPHRIQATLAALRQRFGNLTVMVARELTKAHEALQVGSLDQIDLSQHRGEFTVVVDFGQMPSKSTAQPQVSAAQIVSEFGDATNNSGLTRRQAISSLSRKYGLQARDVYSMLEAGKKSPV
ncbi:MAG TPA: 16S rRNA (cytidine(1402)-2'-O)-methyltransferase [Vicinamibacterales bacterium]|nr:16S rRNA (cytidine(1402)-2'-O)-methyltransferase [Vicinamibacterales bacterium]